MSKTTLKEITTKIGSGATPSGGQKSYQEEGIALIRSQNVLDFRFSKNGLAFINDEQAEQLDNVTVEEGDVLLNITGDSIARVCQVPKEILPARVNQHVSIIRTKKDIDSRYILYYLQYLKPYLLKICKVGGTRNALTKEAIEKLEIEIRDNHAGIAAVLSALDAKIELNQRINAELESMAKTLYDYWFVQFATPSVLRTSPPNATGDRPSNLGEVPAIAGGGGGLVWNEALKREIPLGWEVCELRKYITSKRGVSYSGKDIVGDGVPMINLNSFNMGNGSYKPEGIKTYSGEYGENKILKPFDLVMCNTQQTALDPKKDIIGKSFLIPDIFNSDIVSSHHVTTVIVEKENLKYYLNSLFNTEYFHRYISGYATGTNILGLNFEGVLSYKTAIPSDDLLDKYKAIVLNVEKQKARIIKESQTLTELRDWLLPMLMNGQIQPPLS